MQVDEVLAQAREAITVKRVFGDPFERDGLTIIPVANVMGGGGGGSGEGPFPGPSAADPATDGAREAGDGATGSGMGVGFGVRATPAGVYVIKDGVIRWEPALDLTRIAIMGQIVAIIFLLVVRSVLTSRSKR
jgi:uncharacterized spore protein YtfJ